MLDLTTFNPEQREAVTLPICPNELKDILVVAGAGSGKTRVLIHRIAYLNEHDIPPHAILAVTFTKKAANEMQERLVGLVPTGTPIKIGTFHSIASDLLRKFKHDRFDIIDSLDQSALLKAIVAEHGLKEHVKVKDFLSWLSYLRNKCIDPERGSADDNETVENYRMVARLYTQHKAQLSALDFDDLLEHLVVLLTKEPVLRRRLQARWTHLLVDEYQDTNRRQYQLINLLRGKDTQLLQVGDEDQLIYSWRGAEIAHIMNAYQSSLEDENVHCVMLNKNYRCTANILTVANAVVESNTQRTGKALTAHHSAGKPVNLWDFRDEQAEALALAEQFEQWHLKGVPYEDMTILLRVNRMARGIERALIERQIPYKLHNGIALFERKEIRLVMSLMWFALRPEQTFYFQKIMEVIKMGLGTATLSKLDRKRRDSGLDWFAFLSADPKLSEKLRIAELLAIFEGARVLMMAGELSAAARYWFHHWDLVQFFKEEEQEAKELNLQLFFGVLEDYEYACASASAGAPVTMSGFQEERLLNESLTDKGGFGKVNVMTIHKSKGLEFPYGAVVGMQDGVFPKDPFALGKEGDQEGDEPDSEEDWRLAYVAITRYMKELIITRAGFRVGFNELSLYSSILDPHLSGLKKTGAIEHSIK
jgi:DNA helicase II / ATP-dependent DNA helicase PcrA